MMDRLSKARQSVGALRRLDKEAVAPAAAGTAPVDRRAAPRTASRFWGNCPGRIRRRGGLLRRGWFGWVRALNLGGKGAAGIGQYDVGCSLPRPCDADAVEGD